MKGLGASKLPPGAKQADWEGCHIRHHVFEKVPSKAQTFRLKPKRPAKSVIATSAVGVSESRILPQAYALLPKKTKYFGLTLGGGCRGGGSTGLDNSLQPRGPRYLLIEQLFPEIHNIYGL